MKARMIEIPSLPVAAEQLRAIGVEPAGVEIMAPKMLQRVVKLSQVKAAAANIIKQEMLSLGGEAATAYGAINCSVPASDVLISGTLKQLGQLTEKLKKHQFGLPTLAAEINEVLERCAGSPASIQIGSLTLDFGSKTYIMGVVNVTPDSFSDGGKFFSTEAAVRQAEQLIADGADLLDIGGESTRPGSEEVSAEEEIRRVVPVIEQLAKKHQTPISIDTTKAAVAAAAVQAGAALINDISGLRFDPQMAAVAAAAKVPVCLMHTSGRPKTMQQKTDYHDLMGEIIDYLATGLAIAKNAGILTEKILVDPGLGFGKTAAQNLEIIDKLAELRVLGRPILIGPSRKSFIGQVLDLPLAEREEGSAAAAAAAIARGADLVRVHDVKAMVRTAKITDAIMRRRG